VSRAELEAYYLRAKIPLIRTAPTYTPDIYATAITRELFDLLDKNKDGKITPDEARAAEAWLDKFDLDEDECLSLAELAPHLLNPQRGQLPTMTTVVPPMVFSRIDMPVATLAQQFLNRYDTDKDFHLSQTEIGLDGEAFAALDRERFAVQADLGLTQMKILVRVVSVQELLSEGRDRHVDPGENHRRHDGRHRRELTTLGVEQVRRQFRQAQTFVLVQVELIQPRLRRPGLVRRDFAVLVLSSRSNNSRVIAVA